MAKLGSKKRPAIVRVGTQSRAAEIVALCEDHGWQVIVGVEPDEPEDLADLRKLMKARSPTQRPGFTPRRSRNDYCPCGSGKKYRNCCWDEDHQE